MTMLWAEIIVLAIGILRHANGACSNDATPTDGAGVKISEEIYECKYLQQQLPDDNHGIYTNRVTHCEQPTTDCCKTCEEILSCQDRPYGITVLNMGFDCKYLLNEFPEDENVGIYKNRHQVCNESATKCCYSCSIVKNEIPSSTVTSTTKSPPPTKSTIVRTPTPVPVVYEDTCTGDCLWIADGTYGTCGWLTDPSKDVYDQRHTLCNQGMAPGCQFTCHNILNSVSTTSPKVSTNAPDACVDTHLMVDKHSLDCSALRDPTSDVYTRRWTLCEASTTSCCKTCRALSQETPIVNGDQNDIYDTSSGTEMFVAQIEVQPFEPDLLGDKPKLKVFVNLYRLLAEREKFNLQRQAQERQPNNGPRFRKYALKK